MSAPGGYGQQLKQRPSGEVASHLFPKLPG
jgi:hypothetical protein